MQQAHEIQIEPTLGCSHQIPTSAGTNVQPAYEILIESTPGCSNSSDELVLEKLTVIQDNKKSKNNITFAFSRIIPSQPKGKHIAKPKRRIAE